MNEILREVCPHCGAETNFGNCEWCGYSTHEPNSFATKRKSLTIYNLTGHDINLPNKVIKSDGIVRLEFKTIQFRPERFGFPAIRREITGLYGDTDLLDRADAVIVSAQLAPYLKEHFKNLMVFTVGETIREKDDNGNVVIKGAKNLVLN